MKISFRKYSVLGFICILLLSCERDDICPPSTPTTPLLIIEFFDFAEPDSNKNVQGLSYIAEGSTDTILLNNTDSIAIPLNSNLNTTRYKFIRNTNNDNLENVDEVEFIYQVDDIYVNRSCGFKAVFRNISAIRQVEDPISNNWIRSVENTEQIDVVNEQNTHILIFH
jgi:hypothetical protein